MVIKIRMVITTGEKGLVSGGELKGVSRALVILYTLTLVKKLHRFFHCVKFHQAIHLYLHTFLYVCFTSIKKCVLFRSIWVRIK